MLSTYSQRRFWKKSSNRKKKEGDDSPSNSGSSTPVLSSPRSSVHLEDLDLFLPSQSTPVPPEAEEKKITMETIIQKLVQSESAYVDELAVIVEVQSTCSVRV